jgi:DNA polymerase III subunit epsilon
MTDKLPVFTWSSKPASLETKTTLDREGLRLAKDQQPRGRVRGRYEWYDLYDRAEAIPKRPPSAAQLAALKKASAAALLARTCRDCNQVMPRRAGAGQLDGDGVCRDCALQRLIIQTGHEAAAWFKDLAGRGDWFVVDTETTGLDDTAEIVEIAIVDAAGKLLFHSRVKPAGPIPPEATAIHGLDDAAVATAPAFPQIYSDVAGLLGGRAAVCFNAEFDERMLRQTCRQYGLAVPAASWACAMERYAQLGGDWSSRHGDWRYTSLINACAANGVVVEDAHTAAGDALLVWRLIQRIAGLLRQWAEERASP